MIRETLLIYLIFLTPVFIGGPGDSPYLPDFPDSVFIGVRETPFYLILLTLFIGGPGDSFLSDFTNSLYRWSGRLLFNLILLTLSL